MTDCTCMWSDRENFGCKRNQLNFKPVMEHSFIMAIRVLDKLFSFVYVVT